ncbi:hypothetical protein LCGC14_1375560 [marine sediment metagenome]|uniref:Cytochrome c assembly protein domain-containing protein n=1 Tax=marine sediment metagenome TaxID=412755 RepID=A0A0F9KQ32_9ZZZZ|nr:hypothetical protein [Actinomycetota bacterium]
MVTQQLSVAFFWLAMASYISSFIFYVAKLKSPNRSYLKAAQSFMVTGLVLATLTIVLRVMAVGSIGNIDLFELFLIASWVVVLQALIVEKWSNVKILGLYASVLAVFLMLVGWSRYNVPQALFENLKSTSVLIHVALIVIAYASFFIAAGAAVFFLLQEKSLKEKKQGVLQKFLPSLQVLDEAAFRSIAGGFVLFTIALVLGFGSAIKLWENSWDVTIIISSLITWGLYLFYLFSRIGIGWVGRNSSYLAIAGLVPVAITSIVTYLSSL